MTQTQLNSFIVVSEFFALTNKLLYNTDKNNNHHKVHTLTYFGVHSATSAWIDPLTCSLQTADAVTLPCQVIWILQPLLTWCRAHTSCSTHIHQTPVRLCLSAIIWLFKGIDGHLSSCQPASLSCCSCASHSTWESALNPPKHWRFDCRCNKDIKKHEKMSFLCVTAVLFDMCFIVRNGESAWRMGRPHIMTLTPITWPGNKAGFIGHSLHTVTLGSFVTMNDHPLIKLRVVHSLFCLQRICRTDPCLWMLLSIKGKKLVVKKCFLWGTTAPYW